MDPLTAIIQAKKQSHETGKVHIAVQDGEAAEVFQLGQVEFRDVGRGGNPVISPVLLYVGFSEAGWRRD